MAKGKGGSGRKAAPKGRLLEAKADIMDAKNPQKRNGPICGY